MLTLFGTMLSKSAHRLTHSAYWWWSYCIKWDHHLEDGETKAEKSMHPAQSHTAVMIENNLSSGQAAHNSRDFTSLWIYEGSLQGNLELAHYWASQELNYRWNRNFETSAKFQRWLPWSERLLADFFFKNTFLPSSGLLQSYSEVVTGGGEPRGREHTSTTFSYLKSN